MCSSDLAHEAIVNRRNKRLAVRRGSMTAHLIKSSQASTSDSRQYGAHSIHPSPAHSALLRIKANKPVTDDQITLDSINHVLWGRAARRGAERQSEDHRQYWSAVEMCHKTPLHVYYAPQLIRRHSFDAIDSARSKFAYYLTDDECRSMACSPRNTDYEAGLLTLAPKTRGDDSESMLNNSMLQIHIENYDDKILTEAETSDNNTDDGSAFLQSLNHSTGFDFTDL